MKYNYEKLILPSFREFYKLSIDIYGRFVGIRRVLTELEADNWKHSSNYTVTLSLSISFQNISQLERVGTGKSGYIDINVTSS